MQHLQGDRFRGIFKRAIHRAQNPQQTGKGRIFGVSVQDAHIGLVDSVGDPSPTSEAPKVFQAFFKGDLIQSDPTFLTQHQGQQRGDPCRVHNPAVGISNGRIRSGVSPGSAYTLLEQLVTDPLQRR